MRLWKVEAEGEDRKITYLTTLIKVCLQCTGRDTNSKALQSIPRQSMWFDLRQKVKSILQISQAYED